MRERWSPPPRRRVITLLGLSPWSTAAGAILIERMDHAAYLASVELAPGKARIATLFKKPGQALEDAINRGRLAAVTAQGFTEM